MKLIYYILVRISLALTVILTGWAIFFISLSWMKLTTRWMMHLKTTSEIIIIRALAGEELPSRNTASNNQYFLKEVTEEYAVSRENILYKDSMVYIPEKEKQNRHVS